MCAGFADLSPLLFYFLSWSTAAANCCTAPLWTLTELQGLLNTTNKKAKLTYQNCPLNLNWSTIIVKHKETASSFHKCCQGRKHTAHSHNHTLTTRVLCAITVYISIYTYRHIHKYTQSNLVNVIRSAEREGNRPASHLCIGNTGEIDE